MWTLSGTVREKSTNLTIDMRRSMKSPTEILKTGECYKSKSILEVVKKLRTVIEY